MKLYKIIKLTYKPLCNLQFTRCMFSVVAIALGSTHPSFAQGTTPCVNNEGSLSASGEVCVQKFILDGIHQDRWEDLKKHFKDKKFQFYENCQLNLEEKFEKNQLEINKLYEVYQDKLAVDKRITEKRIAILIVADDVKNYCQMTAEQIYTLKNQITRYYIDRGYINSGAIIPDQHITNDGMIVMRIIEGWLAKVDIETGPENENNENQLTLSEAYIKRRLKFAGDKQRILDMNELQERLQIMQQNPFFKYIQGRVAPGNEPGEGILKVKVGEAERLQAGFRFNNYRHPSVGAYRGAVEFNYQNFLPRLGLGDSLYFRAGLTEGLNDYFINYNVPFPSLIKYDATLSLSFSKSDSEIVSEAFRELDVQSDSETWVASLRQPIYKSYPPTKVRYNPNPYQELALALKLDRRRNTTFLWGERFSFSRGAIDGETEYNAIRLSLEWLSRSQHNVFAFYNTFSCGTDVLNNTFGSPTVDERFIINNSFDLLDINEQSDKNNFKKFGDNHFRSWLTQLQWYTRLNHLWVKRTIPWLWESGVLARVNVQFADRELLSLEKFSLGGHASVRGYRESELIRDNGIFISLEGRIPLAHLQHGQFGEFGVIELVPFFDFGSGWNKDEDSIDISSIGIGLHYSPIEKINFRIYWAHALQEIESTRQKEHDLQDEGVHFEMEINLLPW